MRNRAGSVLLGLGLLGVACGGPTDARPLAVWVAALPPVAPAEAPKTETLAPGQLAPLTEAQRGFLNAGDADHLTAPTDISYFASNEIRHDLFFPYIRDKAGLYVGVGSDPNYTLIAQAKAEFAVLLDIDPRMVDLHRIYKAFILASDRPEQLHERFHRDQAGDSIALLEAAFADAPAPQRRRILASFRTGRETVYRHLRHVIARKRDEGPTTWLSNAASYRYVRELYRAGRVRIMAGDLAGTHTMQTVAFISRSLGAPVRVLYESNAEEYFVYKARYRANIRGLPTDTSSVLCRTISTKPINTKFGRTFERADMMWNYQVQSLPDYQARLERKHLNRNLMLKLAERDGSLRRRTDKRGLSLVALAVAADSPAPHGGL